jgi:Family of unknown function (DUF6328)
VAVAEPLHSAAEAEAADSASARSERNLAELLQELRVAGLGVQVLFGFLLALPFAARFAQVGSWQRADYVATLLLAAVSTVLLVGPVAFHRILFRRHQRASLLRSANRMAIGGLVTVSLAVSGAVLLAVSGAVHGVVVPIVGVVSVAVFALVWFVIPLNHLRSVEEQQADRVRTNSDAKGAEALDDAKRGY